MSNSRANIYLRDSDHTAGMYLYTHHGAQSWPDRLQAALRFGETRWGDPSYLARIIASHVFADITLSTTGGGLSTELVDNDYPLLCVDLIGCRVGLYGYDLDVGEINPHDMSTWTDVTPFGVFCDQDLDNWFPESGWAPHA